LRPRAPGYGFECKSVHNSGRLDLRRHDVEQWEELKRLRDDGHLVLYAVWWGSTQRWEFFHPHNGPILHMGQGTDELRFLSAVFPLQPSYKVPTEGDACS